MNGDDIHKVITEYSAAKWQSFLLNDVITISGRDPWWKRVLTRFELVTPTPRRFTITAISSSLITIGDMQDMRWWL